jgi:hypothetical protein
MWVQFISPSSLQYSIHYFPTESDSLWPVNSLNIHWNHLNIQGHILLWWLRRHFDVYPFVVNRNYCNCDMLPCCWRGAWSRFGIFRSRWVWIVGIGANGRLGYPLVVHLLDFLCLLFGDWIRHDDVIRGRYWQRIPARSFLVYWLC